MDTERILTHDEALGMIPKTKKVHTYKDGQTGMLFGCDWHQKDLKKELASAAELLRSGPHMSSRGYGLCLWYSDGSQLFVNTRK